MFDFTSASSNYGCGSRARTARLRGVIWSVLFGCVLAAAPEPAKCQSRPMQVEGCGTIGSSFDEDRCVHVSFTGEVSAGQTYERKFGAAIRFRLNPKPAQSGWFIEVIPDDQSSGYSEYVWVVNPPYHFNNVRYLDTSYGTSAKQAVEYSARDFNFVLNPEQYKRASDLVEMGVSSHPATDQRSQQQLEKETDDAIRALEALPVAKGRLTILNSRIHEVPEKNSSGSIEWLKFRVELHVPCGFLGLIESADLQIDRANCAAATHKGRK